ncbi:DNA primase [bacterium]|nr:DNA primase [bacterium]
MTSEEIKATTTMTDILTRYGLEQDRHKMLSCPFHGTDRHASMKIYSDGYHCFTCGAHGDIFGFVMQYEGVSFKEAFRILGGTYERSTSEDRRKASIVVERRKRQVESNKRRAERKKREQFEQNVAISGYRHLLEKVEPASDLWARYMLALCDLLQRKEWEDEGYEL